MMDLDSTSTKPCIGQIVKGTGLCSCENWDPLVIGLSWVNPTFWVHPFNYMWSVEAIDFELNPLLRCHKAQGNNQLCRIAFLQRLSQCTCPGLSRVIVVLHSDVVHDTREPRKICESLGFLRSFSIYFARCSVVYLHLRIVSRRNSGLDQ